MRASAAAEAGAPGEPRALAPGRDPRRCTTTSAARTTSSSACREWCASSCSTARRARRSPRTSATTTRSRSTSPGRNAHGYEALTDCLFCYFVTEEYDPASPTSTASRGTIRASSHLWSTRSPILSERDQRVAFVITGAGGQLGHALAEAFPDARALTRADWDVTLPPPRGPRAPTSSCTRPPGRTSTAPRTTRRSAAAVNVGGMQHAAELGAPLVVCSSDYVFDGAKREPYVESDAPGAARRLRTHEAARRGRRGRPCLDRALLVALRLDVEELRAHDAAARRGTRRGRGRRRPARLPDVRRPSRGGDRAGAPRCRSASTTSPPAGDCTWADFAEAIFEEAGLDTRVRRITTAEFGARAPRPAYSVLRSEQGAPELPHWRDGLRECLARL